MILQGDWLNCFVSAVPVFENENSAHREEVRAEPAQTGKTRRNGDLFFN